MPIEPGPILASAFKALDEAMAEIPEGNTKALVFGATTDGMVSMGLAAKVGSDWKVVGQLSADIKAGKVRNITGAVRASWSR